MCISLKSTLMILIRFPYAATVWLNHYKALCWKRNNITIWPSQTRACATGGGGMLLPLPPLFCKEKKFRYLIIFPPLCLPYKKLGSSFSQMRQVKIEHFPARRCKPSASFVTMFPDFTFKSSLQMIQYELKP